MLLACSAVNRIGIGETYAEPTDPACVKELFQKEISTLPAMITKKSLGFFDFRECQAHEIGVAWVKEKRLRMKYQKQIKILNE